MKHLFYIFVCVLSLFPYQARTAEIVFKYIDPLEKILPEAVVFPTADAFADVARGEHATFQFVVRSQENIKKMQVSLHDFKHIISGKPLLITIFNVSFPGYVRVGRPQLEPGNDLLTSASGYYPDPLLDDQSIDVSPGVNAPVWVSIPIDKKMEPGLYEGKVSIKGTINNTSFVKTLPIKIKVYSTVVEDQTLFITNWYQDGFSWVDRENPEQFSEKWWKLMNELADIMSAYRQNVVMISPLRLAEYTFSDGKVQHINFDRFDKVVDFFNKKGILKRIAGGHVAGRQGGWQSPFGYYIPKEIEGKTSIQMVDFNDPAAQEFYGYFFTELKKHLKEKGWEAMYMQHIADEPIKSNAESYISIASFVREQIPEFKIIDACHTKEVNEQIDIWVPQLNYLHKDFEFYKDQQEKGKEVWYYTCVWPQGNYANRYIQQPLIKTRLLHWINYKYGINGYLHWGLNFWRGSDPMVETSAVQPDGLVLPGGDAWVVYPYKNHLVTSIRLDAMRDGIIDYELLKLLEKKDKEKARQLANSLIYDFDKYDTEIVHFRSIRKSLLEALED